MRFLEFNNVSARQILDWPLEKYEDAMLDFVDYQQRKDLSGSWIRVAWASITRFWEDNHRNRIRVKCGVKIRRKIFDYIPTKDDLRLILGFDYGDKPMFFKTGISLMAFAGLRPSDMLRLQWDNITRSWNREDEILTITIQQKKTRQWYSTFLGPEGMRYLKQLIRNRRNAGERFRADTYVLSTDGMKAKTTTWNSGIKRIIDRTIGYHPTGESFKRMRAYSLRKYYRRQLAFSQQFTQSEMEFLMGHKTDLSGRYAGLADFDDIAIRRLKEKYVKSLQHLETELNETAVKGRIERLEEQVAELREQNQNLRDPIRWLEQMKKELSETGRPGFS